MADRLAAPGPPAAGSSHQLKPPTQGGQLFDSSNPPSSSSPSLSNQNSLSQKQLMVMVVGGGHIISEQDESAEGMSPVNNQILLASSAAPKGKARVTAMEDFDITSKLGDGAYSSVYRVKRIADGEIYALKKVKLHHLSDKEKDNAINEVRILASLKNVNIIQYKEAFVEPATQSLCIVMEYADNGDLFQKISEHAKGKTAFSEQEIWKIFIQIVRGLKAMHDLNIMHRDLKSANVFLNKDFTAKLGDMNVSKVANKRGLNYTQTGTPYYASPEVWRDEPYDIKSDIWSLGCVLYEMIALKPPFTAEDMQGLYKKVLKGHFPRIPKSYSHDLWTMCKTLLQVTAQSRPNCEQIMSFPTFAKKFEKYFHDNHNAYYNEQQNILLKTIKFPKNLMYLSDRLPKQNYKGMQLLSASMDEHQLHQIGHAAMDFINSGQSLATHRQSRKNLHLVNPNLSPMPLLNQKGSQSQITQQQKELRLPSIQNVKQQQYMNQINLVGRTDEGGTDYAAAYAYKKKLAAQKKKVQRVTVDVNDHVSTEDGVVYRSSSTLAEESLEITPVQPLHRKHQLLHNLNKRSSIQLNGNLEVLSEEGHGKDKEGLLHSPSEKRYRMQNSLDAQNSQDDNGSISSRHASPVLLKSQASKKFKGNQVTISQDYSQKRLLSLNQPSSNPAIQRVAGIYNAQSQARPIFVSQREKQLMKGNHAVQQQQFLLNSPSKDHMGRVSPNVQISLDTINPLEDHYSVALAQGGLSSERGKPSASSRVQELISRYNLNNLKLNLHSKDHSQSIGAIKKSGKFNMHLEGTMNYSIAPLNGPEKAMQPNTSKHELLVAMQNTEQVILKNQQNVINAIRNAKIRKTRNSNSKSIVSPAPPMEESSPVVAILAQRISNNKTTVEPGDLQGSIVRKNISPLKNSGLVLPSIDSNKFTLMPSYNDPQNMQTAQVSPQRGLNRQVPMLTNALSPRLGKKSQRKALDQQQMPGYPYLQMLPRNKSNFEQTKEQ